MVELMSAKTISGVLRNLEEAADNDSSHRRGYFLDAIAVIEDLEERLNTAKNALVPFARESKKYDGWIDLVLLFSGSGEEEWSEASYTVKDLRLARDIVNSGEHA